MSYRFLNVKHIKDFCKERGRRTGADFLSAINGMIADRLGKACETKNGPKNTLDGDVAAWVGFKGSKQGD